jgi:hypothetical protein
LENAGRRYCFNIAYKKKESQAFLRACCFKII